MQSSGLFVKFRCRKVLIIEATKAAKGLTNLCGDPFQEIQIEPGEQMCPDYKRFS